MGPTRVNAATAIAHAHHNITASMSCADGRLICTFVTRLHDIDSLMYARRRTLRLVRTRHAGRDVVVGVCDRCCCVHSCWSCLCFVLPGCGAEVAAAYLGRA